MDELHDLQVNLVKQLIERFPGWSLNDILNTDVKYLHEIMFTKTPNKKQKKTRPLSDLVKGGN
ncbi:hypothetical protein [Enterococcus italicus]|uniref:hypothetical protein n=1 Tax=Enterococcus italicus TaxID=246144 RepID=UPI002073FB5E|nr:hypothetical protein [Enterococcus italicus]